MAPPDDSDREDEVPVRRPELWMVDGEDEKRAAGKDDWEDGGEGPTKPSSGGVG